MSDFPQKAHAVIIGAGIVGNSMAYHLARKGWKDMVLIDKGPLPNPGGSTGHASNFIFPLDHSKEMTQLTVDSMNQYKALGVFTESGGIEVARTEARMEELRRRLASAKAWGIDSRLITPDEVQELVPFLDKNVILGGFYTPSVGVVDSLRAGTLMREYAVEQGALSVFPNTEVYDIFTENGRVTGVSTDRGDVQAEYVIICSGVWSPKLAEMAGATIPLTPAVHQMISVGPISLFEEQTHIEIEYPIIRDMDTFMYERQNGNDMEVGSYAHRPILMRPADIPSIEDSVLSPTELPITMDDFEPQLEQALELMPDFGRRARGIRHAINGLLCSPPMVILSSRDGRGQKPLVGRCDLDQEPGFARAVAEWMVNGAETTSTPPTSPAADYARTEHHIRARTSEGYNKTYGIVHPREQWLSNREARVSPFYLREKELGAVFFETAGWERPQWYESNAKLLDHYGAQIQTRDHEWDARWWSPIINAEHLAMRERVAMVDLSAFAIFDVIGPGALDYLQCLTVNQMDVPVGRLVYTPLLNPRGGFKADLTITRTGANAFRIVTGGGDGARDKKWFLDNLPQNGSVTFTDMTSALATLGLWGPHARDVLQKVTHDDVSNEGFPYGEARNLTIGGVPAWAMRISYVGELGWEIYTPTEHGLKLWDTIWEAGQEFGIVPVGIGVYGTTGRLEKGYRLMSAELDGDYNPVEAGLAAALALVHRRGGSLSGAGRACRPLHADRGRPHWPAVEAPHGGVPIPTAAGSDIDAHGRRSYVTSAGAALRSKASAAAYRRRWSRAEATRVRPSTTCHRRPRPKKAALRPTTSG